MKETTILKKTAIEENQLCKQSTLSDQQRHYLGCSVVVIKTIFAIAIFALLIACLSFSTFTVPFYGTRPRSLFADLRYHDSEIYLWIVAGIVYCLYIILHFSAKRYIFIKNEFSLMNNFLYQFIHLLSLITFTVIGILPIFLTVPYIALYLYIKALVSQAKMRQISLNIKWFGIIALISLILSVICIYFFLPLYANNPINLGNGKFFGITGDGLQGYENGFLVYVILVPFYTCIAALLLACSQASWQFYTQNRQANLKSNANAK